MNRCYLRQKIMGNWLLHRLKLILQCLFTFGICLALQSCSDDKKLESDYQWPIIEGFPKPQVP